MVRLAVLGGGRMGEALVAGLREAGWEPDEVAVAEVEPDRRRALEERFPGVRVVPSPAWAVADAEVVVVAAKPAHAAPALPPTAGALPRHAPRLPRAPPGAPAGAQPPPPRPPGGPAPAAT